MPNTLTNLLPDVYEALDIVSRELVGMIPSVTADTSANRATLNQNVRSFRTRAATVADISPSMTLSEPTDQTVDNVPVIITKQRAAEFGWTGTEQGAMNRGPGYARIRQDQIVQAVRALTNEIESDLAGLHINASRAYGTAGTTPFASDLSDTAQVRKILADNGAPLSELRLVMDTSAGAKVRSLTQLTKVNEGGESSLLRQGVMLDIHGFELRESAQIKTFAKGTGSAYTTSTAGFAVGATSIAIITGTGTVLAGDVVTFAGDTNKYVVDTGVSAPGTIVLEAPGLRQAIPASATAMTIVGNSARNLAFAKSAIVLATRLPEMPEEGDQADDGVTVTDERSGLTYEVLVYKGRRKVRYEIGIAWGSAMIKPEHCAILLG